MTVLRCAAIYPALFLLVIPFGAHAGTHWVRAWGTSLQALDDPTDYPAAAKVWKNVTIRQTVRMTVGGMRLSVRLSNRFGGSPLIIGGARIALKGTGASIKPDSDRALLFGGHSSVTIPTGAPVISDPVDMTVAPLQELVISLYLPTGTGNTPSLHLETRQPTVLAEGGDQTSAITVAAATTSDIRYFLEGIDIEAPDDVGTVVALGDSITDGYGSTQATYHAWPDRLAELLNSRRPHPALAVVNAGISGNRMLHDIVGPAALERLDRDALDVPGVKVVMLLEGINDLYQGDPPAPFRAGESSTAEQLIFAYGQMIERAHRRGIKIMGATIMPNPEDVKAHPGEEAHRRRANLWIKSKSGFDAVVDFDAVMRDPSNPGQLRPDFDSGDHLHPNDAGYRVMAGSVAGAIAGMKRW